MVFWITTKSSGLTVLGAIHMYKKDQPLTCRDNILNRQDRQCRVRGEIQKKKRDGLMVHGRPKNRTQDKTLVTWTSMANLL